MRYTTLAVATCALLGVAACGEDIGTCTGNCPNAQPIPAAGVLTFAGDGTQTTRDIQFTVSAFATLADGVVTFDCAQDGEAISLKVPSSADVGTHNLQTGTGYAFALTEQSSDVPVGVRGDYAVSDATAPAYGTVNLTELSLDKNRGRLVGSVDATLHSVEEPTRIIRAQIGIGVSIAVPLQ